VRIPFPTRFTGRQTFLFTVLLLMGQLLVGTDLTFALLSSAYVIIFVLAFNAAGGMNFASGAFIFFNGFLTAILGLCFKCFLLVPGEKNLVSPLETMTIYCAGMGGMGVAVFLSSRIRPRSGLLAGFSAGPALKQAAVGCLVLGIGLQLLPTSISFQAGSVSSALNQLNHFVQMAIILGTTYAVKSSDGKRSSNWIVWTGIAWTFFLGVLTFSKEGMFIGSFAWLISAAALRFNFSKKQLCGFAVAMFLTGYFLVPFSQYGRTFRTEDTSRSVALAAALPLLLHPEVTRQLYEENISTSEFKGAPHFYDTDEGLLEREQMLAYDDAIITYTDQGNVFGLSPVYTSFINVIPHFLWPDKPGVYSGNEYGRELGVINEDDVTTGISFSPTGDAYHEAKWFGILVVEPIVMFLLFFVMDTLSGDIRFSPWGLLPIALAAHIAPEGLLQGAIYLMTYGSLAQITVALLARYILPLASRLLTGGDRAQDQTSMEFGQPGRPGEA
jgi:hypothetical protein